MTISSIASWPTPSASLCEGGRLELIEEATHWVQHEEPDRVNRLLLDFLEGSKRG